MKPAVDSAVAVAVAVAVGVVLPMSMSSHLVDAIAFSLVRCVGRSGAGPVGRGCRTRDPEEVAGCR